jgi:hypothetical protein
MYVIETKSTGIGQSRDESSQTKIAEERRELTGSYLTSLSHYRGTGVPLEECAGSYLRRPLLSLARESGVPQYQAVAFYQRSWKPGNLLVIGRDNWSHDSSEFDIIDAGEPPGP